MSLLSENQLREETIFWSSCEKGGKEMGERENKEKVGREKEKKQEERGDKKEKKEIRL